MSTPTFESVAAELKAAQRLLGNEDIHKAFTTSLITYLTSDAGLNHLEETAKVTARAIKTSDMLNALEARLRTIDSKYSLEHKKFASVLLQHENDFNDAIKTSKEEAIYIAVYGERFAQVILPVIKDDTFSVDDKNSHCCLNRFRRRPESPHQCQAYCPRGEIKSLTDQIKSTRNATKTGMGAVAGVAAVGLVFLGLPFPPELPAVITGGCYVCGAILTAGAVSGAILTSWESDLRAKLKEKDDLSRSLTDIEQARTGLITLGEIDLAIYKTSVGGISSIWKSAQLSAKELLSWLEAAETDVSWINKAPSMVATDLDQAVKIYCTMAKYLRDYAHGVETTCIM
ncbi:hypothetical protein B0I35DRAFT_415468 [Stachybotrys elegans]|uniref:Uncharacterized protein n=1 Tax=Stachybotrys elegans TaxID=80388 RepID=A0A8K0WIK3_9HYPO|nr:hypothetical protein B0I35DRAFT_415468 [Stachybotrys elegans]